MPDPYSGLWYYGPVNSIHLPALPTSPPEEDKSEAIEEAFFNNYIGEWEEIEDDKS